MTPKWPLSAPPCRSYSFSVTHCPLCLPVFQIQSTIIAHGYSDFNLFLSLHCSLSFSLSMWLQASLSLCLSRFSTMKPFLYRSGFVWQLKGSMPSSGSENKLHCFELLDDTVIYWRAVSLQALQMTLPSYWLSCNGRNVNIIRTV